jgi:hypothetical protein
MLTCTICREPFHAKRADARVCSAKCRKAAFLARRGGQERAEQINGYEDTPSPIGTDNSGSVPPPDRPDDGLRWIDRWGYIHRSPAGTRSQLPRPKV